jgi:hypothetical protein
MIEKINLERRTNGLFIVPKATVRLLGQMSLLSHDHVAMVLSLAQTGDLDAFLVMEETVKKQFDFENISIESIDPESALVSKAVKAPLKNKQLIREAIASGEFPTLIDRILANDGKLEDFT